MKKLLFILPLVSTILCSCCGNGCGDRVGTCSKNRSCQKKECSREQNSSDNEQSADWAVTARAKKAIMTTSGLSASARTVSVETNDGVVTLTGTVASREEMNKVVRATEGVQGVMRVDNQLTVGNY